MSNWGLGASMGEGFAKLSTLAESAAQTAAAVKADAEAKLTASLNADDAAGPQRSAGRVEGKEGEGAMDFSSMPRKELEELCTKRSEKLKQAIQKIRAQQQEYARIQRDYDQLQEIVRADNSNRGADDDPRLTQARIDLKDAREHSAILKQQLASKDAIIAELRQSTQAAPATQGSTPAPGDEVGPSDGSCCDPLRAELKALNIKLEQAQESAALQAELQAEVEQMRAAHQELQSAKQDVERALANQTENLEKLKARSKDIVAKAKTQKAERDELQGTLLACYKPLIK
jgi:DNA anti-recombination protein RmuC